MLDHAEFLLAPMREQSLNRRTFSHLNFMVEIDKFPFEQLGQHFSSRGLAASHKPGQYHYWVSGHLAGKVRSAIVRHVPKPRTSLKTLPFTHSSSVQLCFRGSNLSVVRRTADAPHTNGGFSLPPTGTTLP